MTTNCSTKVSRRPARPLIPDAPLFGVAAGALRAFAKLIVLIVGTGSVGGRIALHLARLGVGGLTLVDPKNYKGASVATHEITPAECNHPKALAVARRCHAISPGTRVVAHVAPVESLDLAEWAAADLVIMAPDLLAAEIAVAQQCLWLGLPLVHASVHGTTLTTQVRFFSNAMDSGGCPACQFGADEWDLLARQVRFNCDGAGHIARPVAHDAHATNSVSGLCSLAADLAANQLLRHVVGLGRPVADTMLEYNGFTHRTVITPIARRSTCRLDHSAFTRILLDGPLSSFSPADLTRQAFRDPTTPGVSLEVAGFDWVEQAACGCSRPTAVRRLVSRTRPKLSRCPQCSEPRAALSFHTHRVVGASFLGDDVARPLENLGARATPAVIVRAGDRGCLVLPRSQPAPTPPVESINSLTV
jgi:molybdopterin/thiamine biosynthesis adenylyltransferase